MSTFSASKNPFLFVAMDIGLYTRNQKTHAITHEDRSRVGICVGMGIVAGMMAIHSLYIIGVVVHIQYTLIKCGMSGAGAFSQFKLHALKGPGKMNVILRKTIIQGLKSIGYVIFCQDCKNEHYTEKIVILGIAKSRFYCNPFMIPCLIALWDDKILSSIEFFWFERFFRDFINFINFHDLQSIKYIFDCYQYQMNYKEQRNNVSFFHFLVTLMLLSE